MDDTHLLLNTKIPIKPSKSPLSCTSIYRQTQFTQKNTENISQLVLKSNNSSPIKTKRNPHKKKSAAELLQWQIHLEIDEALSNIETYSHYTHSPPDIQYLLKFPKTLNMYPWNDIQQCLQYINEHTDIPPENQRLFFRGKEISKYAQTQPPTKRRRSPTLYKCGIRDKSIIYLQCNRASKQCPLVTYGPCSVLITNLKECESLIFDSCAGLLQGLHPVLATIGEGGTYFLSHAQNDGGQNKYVACFKPSDEEAGCQNNPRNRTSQPMREGIVRPSTGHIREAAAFLIDCEQHFHGVPPTIRVEMFYHGFHYNSNSNCLSKIGALQTFIEGEIVENYGMKNFSQRDVHKIGILDIRILNCDRNSANILVQIDSISHRYSLIPIDHGLSFPSKIEILKDEWIWLSWPQSKVPFDPYTTQFIQDIDIERDIQLLRNEFGLSDICLENMRISNIVLQSGVKYGLTLYDIGSLIARRDFHTPSILELLMAQAETLAKEKHKRMQHKNRRDVGRKLFERGLFQMKQPLYKNDEKHSTSKGFMSFSPGLGPTATHIPEISNDNATYSPTPLSDYSSSTSSVKFMKKTYTTVIKDPQLIIKSMSSPSQSIHTLAYDTQPPSLVKCKDIGAYNRHRLSKYPAPFLTPNLNPTSITMMYDNISKTPNPSNMKHELSDCMPELALASPTDTNQLLIQNSIQSRKSYGTEGVFTSLAINFDVNDRQSDVSPHLSTYSTDSLQKEFSLSAAKVQMMVSSDDESDDVPNESNSCVFDHQLSRSTSMFALKSQNNKSPKTLLSNIKANEEYVNDISIVKCMMPMERHVTADDVQKDEHKNEYAIDDNINQTSHLKQREFGIDPIMKRMTHSQNNDLRPTFLHYLQQLLEMQCHRIMHAKKTKVNDEQDAIFDVDTINGAFIWKNEIRKYWSKNMFKLRREERAKERERLINPWQVEHDDDSSEEDEEEFILFM